MQQKPVTTTEPAQPQAQEEKSTTGRPTPQGMRGGGGRGRKRETKQQSKQATQKSQEWWSKVQWVTDEEMRMIFRQWNRTQKIPISSSSVWEDMVADTRGQIQKG